MTVCVFVHISVFTREKPKMSCLCYQKYTVKYQKMSRIGNQYDRHFKKNIQNCLISVFSQKFKLIKAQLIHKFHSSRFYFHFFKISQKEMKYAEKYKCKHGVEVN